MFNENLRILVNNEGSNPSKFSQLVNVNYGTFNYWVTGRNEPKYETLNLLVETYEKKSGKKINLHWLITGEGEMFITQKNTLKRRYYPVDEKIQAFRHMLIKIKQANEMNDEKFSEKIGLSLDEFIDFIGGSGQPEPKIFTKAFLNTIENFDITADALLFGE